VIEGERVTLMCNISGSEPLDISWTNGKQVWNQPSLTFESVNRRDAGTYNMTVNNGEECNKTDTTSLILNVNCEYNTYDSCYIRYRMRNKQMMRTN
jgi:hypothetical protein